MISLLYIEQSVADHPITQRIRKRFGNATCIPIDRYSEVFNRKAQNFRLQKKKPALILARKFERYVLPAPAGYGIGAQHNFYMSHMLNCIYDCRYCFLQGMYRSAHYVLFVNFEDFQQAMLNKIEANTADSCCFFSGYDCDSLALEPISAYVSDLLPFFARHPRALLELRTKSTQVRRLLKQKPLPNVIVAFSFTPAELGDVLENKVPAVASRIAAMRRVAEHGWPIGLRFDPLLYDLRYRELYKGLFESIFGALPADCLHSVSLGPFRLPRDFFRAVERLYPYERLFAAQFAERNNIVSYPPDIEQEMVAYCTREILRYIPERLLFRCDF